jgi:hypothetical protein
MFYPNQARENLKLETLLICSLEYTILPESQCDGNNELLQLFQPITKEMAS